MLKQRITERDILINIGDENIFKRYFGDFELGKSYCSKLREDRHPSVGFFIGDEGRIIYNDFSNSQSLNSINYVAHLYNINYKQALEKIALDFNLDKNNLKRVATVINDSKTPIKKKKVVRILVKKWDEKALRFWGTFEITEKELIENKIYNVSKAFVNDWEIKDEGFLRFGYYLIDLDGKEYIKVYVPEHPEKEKKWISSCPMKTVYGLNNLTFQTKTLIITKSVKEMLILKKLYKDVISIQAENKGAINEEIYLFIKEKYNKVIYFGDNDRQGIEIGNLFKEKFGFRFIHFPINFKEKFGIKDVADFVKKWGVNYLKKYLNVLDI